MHLQPIFESCCRNTDRSQQLKLKALLMEFQDSFSKDSSDMGLTNLVEHTINTGDSLPIKKNPRRIPLAKMKEAQDEIRKILDKGVIETSDSP